MNALDSTKIGFIGAGKAGVSLGAYFRSKGLSIGGYVSRSPASSRSAADITASRAFNNIAELAEQCGMIFITTPGSLWNYPKRGIRSVIIRNC